MRIKTWINNTVHEFVNKTWPHKKLDVTTMMTRLE